MLINALKLVALLTILVFLGAKGLDLSSIPEQEAAVQGVVRQVEDVERAMRLNKERFGVPEAVFTRSAAAGNTLVARGMTSLEFDTLLASAVIPSLKAVFPDGDGQVDALAVSYAPATTSMDAQNPTYVGASRHRLPVGFGLTTCGGSYATSLRATTGLCATQATASTRVLVVEVRSTLETLGQNAVPYKNVLAHRESLLSRLRQRFPQAVQDPSNENRMAVNLNIS